MELSSAEAAELLGITPWLVNKWARETWIPCKQQENGQRRFSKNYIQGLALWSNGRQPATEMVRAYRRFYELFGPPHSPFRFVTKAEAVEVIGQDKVGRFDRVTSKNPPYVALFGRRFYDVEKVETWVEQQVTARAKRKAAEKQAGLVKPAQPPLEIKDLRNVVLANLPPDEHVIRRQQVAIVLACSEKAVNTWRKKHLLPYVVRGDNRRYPHRFMEGLAAFAQGNNWSRSIVQMYLIQEAYRTTSDTLTRKRIIAFCEAWAREGKLLETDRACELLDINQTTLNSWVKRYGLPKIKIGLRRYYEPESLKKHLPDPSLKNSAEAAAYLGISVMDLRHYCADSRIAYQKDSHGRVGFSQTELEAFEKALNRSHDLPTADAALELGLAPTTLHSYHEAGLVQGTRIHRHLVTFSHEEITRVKKALGHYIVNDPFKWFQTYVEASRMEVVYLINKQTARKLGVGRHTLTQWRRIGLLPCYIQELLITTVRPPIFYPEFYLDQLKRYAGNRPLSPKLLAEFRDMCAECGRLPLA